MTARAARLASLATATLLLLSLLAPELRLARGFDKLGGRLGIQERHLRVFNNFADAPTNNNVTPDPNFPGYTGAELAIWKAAVEWGTGHGDGSGDPTQATLGDGMADFDPAWMGNAGGVGTTEDNVASAIGSCTEGLLAYTETGFTDGWRIRFCDTRTWADGPGNVNQLSYDLQGVMVHEYGHALGLAHSTTSGASMTASTGPSNEAARSIHPDDVAGLQCIYGTRSPDKPTITAVSVDRVLGLATLQGMGFLPSGNDIWFTPEGVTPPSSDPRVLVTGQPSLEAGTRIVVPIPPDAGPGAVHVHVGTNAPFTLSNGFPFDPAGASALPATATPYNGSGLNPLCMQSQAPPVLGSPWGVVIDALGHPGGAGLSGVLCYAGSSQGIVLAGGELLVELTSPFYGSSLLVSTGVSDLHPIPIPAGVAFLGRMGTCQGLTFRDGTGVRFCNAENVTLGF